MATAAEKPVMLVGIDQSDHSLYALDWAIDRILAPFSPCPPFKLVVLHAKPSPPAVAGSSGPGKPSVPPSPGLIPAAGAQISFIIASDSGLSQHL